MQGQTWQFRLSEFLNDLKFKEKKEKEMEETLFYLDTLTGK